VNSLVYGGGKEEGRGDCSPCRFHRVGVGGIMVGLRSSDHSAGVFVSVESFL